MNMSEAKRELYSTPAPGAEVLLMARWFFGATQKKLQKAFAATSARKIRAELVAKKKWAAAENPLPRVNSDTPRIIRF
ncbi:hypothetical protein EVAR_2604_1 [Eumeta japonica]|uniref:Uncharacterized protein n=1 Tax=Eumeta variegata TaxID=151549 RepID=A0A4C1SP97_EUMVA|nr:hypothetical protein EVAR_2604_1 [Eumeta japonica]